MKAIKKINNNVALCLDGNEKELIAFGKGIGFPKMPYEIKDLNLINMTFYRVDRKFYDLIEEIPDDVFETTAIIVEKAKQKLNRELNPNLVVTLSDHIHFAIERMKKYKKLKMLFSYDIESLYPEETEMGRYAVKLIKKRLYVKLPESEITNIAIHLVNASEESEIIQNRSDTEYLIEEVTQKIESHFSITIKRNEFNYNRFAMHMRYYIKRLEDEKPISGDNVAFIKFMRETEPDIYECAMMIGQYIAEEMATESTDDEMFYLLLHIHRIVQNANE